jgi:chemotaxis protein MotB
MRKSRIRQKNENHDRWLVSYADFITLLFAFFVVMFASSQTNRAHAKAISDAVKKALKEGAVTPKVSAILGGTVDRNGTGNAMRRGPGGTRPQVRPEAASEAPQAVPLTTPMRLLSDNLRQEISGGQVNLRLEDRGLVISLQTASVFPSGGDSISASAYPTIEKLATVLNKLPNPIRLEGHTDSLPINNWRFQSNWELSAARSIAMLRLLNERFGVNSQRMAVVGYADNASVDSNQTEEGRERNRRVDIVIVSDFGMRAEPAQESAAGGQRKEVSTGTKTAKD